MNADEIKQHLDALKEAIRAPEAKLAGASPLSVKKTQLRAIQKTIRHLEKRGIPVPNGLNSERQSLAALVSQQEGSPGSLLWLYDQLLDVIMLLGSACRKYPQRDLSARYKEWRKNTTPSAVLRRTIIAVLKEAAGSASESEILKRVEDKLTPEFTQADMECPHGRVKHWQLIARREKKQMIKDGILTPESRRGRWSLTK